MSVSPIVHSPGSVIAVVLSFPPCFAAHLPPSSARSPDLPTCAISVLHPSFVPHHLDCLIARARYEAALVT
ncbi:hypothetical protein BKA62DRAFT_724495 [Auriculariales sp. MPI-PUGE-AT-0066]|nr:hypothetical protein BKA62DRAFT_724495 [Auriculariales sp. MPI-PUGE-AT-0066]